MSLALLIILGLFVALPLAQLLITSLADGGLQVWQDVLFGRIAPNLLWKPLGNTLAVGTFVAVGVVALGGYIAWLVVRTNLPGRVFIGILASLPYTVPGFAYALAWETVFRNDRLGGQVGFLQNMGLDIPNWLAWGIVPVSLTLLAHYYTLGFLLISAALATINVELDEAARMTGAGRFRILKDITFVLITPALISAALLGFANAVSNFAAPAVLGLPVRFETLSTRIFGLVRIGQVERAYVLTVVLIIVAALILWGNSRIGKGRSYTTLTGKGGRYKPQELGAWRWPLFASALLITLFTTIVPLLVLFGSSFSRKTGNFSGGFTTHFWLGYSDPSIAQGQPGVLHNPQILNAAFNTVWLGLAVALFASVIGILIGYVLVRNKGGRFNSLIDSLSYLPYFIPGIAFGAIYVVQFGRSIGPFPALYGTLTLLILAAVFRNLPFTSQAGQTAIKQISNELE
ncbi:MAG: iron ABC transporter permease, partial [Chloroflexi bacterium]